MPNSSVGGIYASIANLPRNMCFKKRYTCLLCVVPGPKEPPLTCLNRILEPIVNDLIRCESGFGVQIHGTNSPHDPARIAKVYAQVLFNVSDLPATKKLIGAVGLSSNSFPCHHCSITKKDINEQSAYDWRNLPHKHTPTQLLEASFAYEHATSHERRAAVEAKYGLRFSIMSRLAGFQHAASNPVDPLHNSFLGLVKSFVGMLCRGENDLFEGVLPDGTPRIEAFRQIFEQAYYPGHLGRLPSRVTQQFTSSKKRAGAGLKADQWKRIIQMLPIALFAAWRSEEEATETNDEIPDVDLERDEPIEPTRHPRRQRRSGDDPDAPPPPVIRNRARWFAAAVSLTAGLRILHAHNIALVEAEAAVNDIANTARAILSMNEHLTINWHNAMHYAE